MSMLAEQMFLYHMDLHTIDLHQHASVCKRYLYSKETALWGVEMTAVTGGGKEKKKKEKLKVSYIFTYFVFDVSLVPVEDVVHSGAYSSGKGWNRKGWKERPQRLRNHLQGNKGLNWSNLALRQDKQCRQAGALRFTNNK